MPSPSFFSRKVLLLLAAFLFTVSAFAQSDTLYFKDGRTMQGKMAMVKACATAFKKEAGDLDGVSFDGNGVCSCFFEGMAAQMTYKEFMKSLDDEKFMEGIQKDEKSPLYSLMLNCVLSNMSSTDKKGKGKSDGDRSIAKKDSDTKPTNKEEEKNLYEIMIKACTDALDKESSFKTLGIDGEKYCRCAIEKIQAKNMSIDKLFELQDPNSPMFNEIVTPCINDAMAAVNATETKNPDDIRGAVTRDEIPISKLGNVSRVKVKIGSIEKLFIIDSGANDVMISSDFERDLIFDGVVSKKDYLSDKTYALANGEEVTCRRFKLNDMQLGGFTVSNVTVAVIEKKDITFLLGKSLLDKFTHWSINNQSSKLILEK